jgi:hypothetical protein
MKTASSQSSPPRVSFSARDGSLRVTIEATTATNTGTLRDFDHLLAEVRTRAGRLEQELPGALAARDEAARVHARVSRLPLSVLLSGRAGELRDASDAAERQLQAMAAERNSCAVAIRFAIGAAALDGFAHLAAAHTTLSTAGRIWEVLPGQIASASAVLPRSALTRSPVAATPTLPEELLSRWPGLGLHSRDGAGLDLFPGFILSGSGTPNGGTTVTDILGARVEVSEVRVAEHEALPHDASVVDQTWERVNRDGTPDRRYANNSRIPIVAYGCLRITLATGESRTYLISDRAATRRFAEAFQAFQGALRGAHTEDEGDTLDRDEWPGGAPEPVVRVPPPPRASGAHEFTAALVVAATLVGWSLSAPGPQASLAPTSAEMTASASPESSRAAVEATLPFQTEPQPLAQQPQPAPVAQAEPAGVAAPVPPPGRREHTVTRSGANVRSGPSGTADVVRTVSGGTRLAVFSRSGGWVQVGDASPWGWVHSSLLDAAE